MYADTIAALSEQASAKVAEQKRSLPGHVIRSILAGMYVGAAIVLIFTIGGLLSPYAAGAVRFLMGVCFGGALTIVVFAGSELFTGCNLVLTLGVLTKKCTWGELAANWFWTWVGNLIGSVLVAVLVFRAGLLDAEPINGFILKLVETKMNLPPEQLFWRAVLANWFVCLAVWMAARIKSETARIVTIWWCMFTFITSGYEHSIANMCGLMLGLLMPHGDTITWLGYSYNLALATLGNTVGGAILVGGLYWLASPKAREQAVVTSEISAETNGRAKAETAMVTAR